MKKAIKFYVKKKIKKVVKTPVNNLGKCLKFFKTLTGKYSRFCL